MWSSVFGDGSPLNSAIVTLALPTAIPFSNSNSFFSPRVRPNHFALFCGLRTARPKWPTVPREKGIFIVAVATAATKSAKPLLLLLFEKAKILAVAFLFHLLHGHETQRSRIHAITHARWL